MHLLYYFDTITRLLPSNADLTTRIIYDPRKILIYFLHPISVSTSSAGDCDIYDLSPRLSSPQPKPHRVLVRSQDIGVPKRKRLQRGYFREGGTTDYQSAIITNQIFEFERSGFEGSIELVFSILQPEQASLPIVFANYKSTWTTTLKGRKQRQ